MSIIFRLIANFCLVAAVIVVILPATEGRKEGLDKTPREKKALGTITRDYTINLHKLLHRMRLLDQPRRVIKEVKNFAEKGENQIVFRRNVIKREKRATLKDIAMRLKSVRNIQKITESMKMVSAAKYARAERELKSLRPYGEGAQAFYQEAKVVEEANGAPASVGTLKEIQYSTSRNSLLNTENA